jgi:WD40 repeat protein
MHMKKTLYAAVCCLGLGAGSHLIAMQNTHKLPLLRTLENPRRQWFIASLCEYKDTIIAGDEGGNLSVWNKYTGTCIKTVVKGHQQKIQGLLVVDGKLISGSYDGTLKVWDLKDLSLLKTLDDHTGDTIITAPSSNCLCKYNGTVISGSDKTIKQWNITTGGCIKTIRNEDTGYIYALSIVNNTLVALRSNRLYGQPPHYSVQQWDMHTGNELQCCFGFQNTTKLLLADTYIILGFDSGFMLTPSVDRQPSKNIYLQPSKNTYFWQGHVKNACIFGNKIISSGAMEYSKDIMVWDRKTGNRIAMVTGQEGIAHGILVTDDGEIIAGDSNTIKFWDAAAILGIFPTLIEQLSQHGPKKIAGDCKIVLQDQQSTDQEKCDRFVQKLRACTTKCHYIDSFLGAYREKIGSCILSNIPHSAEQLKLVQTGDFDNYSAPQKESRNLQYHLQKGAHCTQKLIDSLPKDLKTKDIKHLRKCIWLLRRLGEGLSQEITVKKIRSISQIIACGRNKLFSLLSDNNCWLNTDLDHKLLMAVAHHVGLDYYEPLLSDK